MPSAVAGVLNPGLEKTVDTEVGAYRPGSLAAGGGTLYARVQAGAAIARGVVVMQAAAPADVDVDLAVADAVAAGDREIPVTLGATTAYTKDELHGGFLFVNDGAGEGQRFKIHGNTAAAVTEEMTITLHPDDEVKVALTTASQVGIRNNAYKDVITYDADGVVGPALGVSVSDIGNDEYGWIQLEGIAAVLTQGVVVVGDPVDVSATVDGAVAAGAGGAVKVGTVVTVGATAEYSLIVVDLPVVA